MKYVFVRFINEEGIVSRLIDFNTESLFCHAEFGVPVDPGNRQSPMKSYIGAHAGTGIQCRPADWCTPTRERRYAIPETDQVYDWLMAEINSKVGTKYDYLGIVGLALHDRKLHKRGAIDCSGFVYSTCTKVGIPLLNVEEQFSYLVTPETLHLSSMFLGNCVYKYPQLEGK